MTINLRKISSTDNLFSYGYQWIFCPKKRQNLRKKKNWITHIAQKLKFFVKDVLNKCDLFIFTEEILNRELNFLYSDIAFSLDKGHFSL